MKTKILLFITFSITLSCKNSNTKSCDEFIGKWANTESGYFGKGNLVRDFKKKGDKIILIKKTLSRDKNSSTHICECQDGFLTIDYGFEKETLIIDSNGTFKSLNRIYAKK
ncbi:hypothetical protein P700755_003719 [Psychroflexus torquis ATCC 700755]|uniref:Lipoprotein n=1 Tax=Psychroflexus torquis (strain ATCC 700755 / CIP 106069 / ACAM 623) TaxID=313595 RepID=K4IIB7_PSYTT|nr:hypothetical protein [Psychroflexus torquis]AFU70307.1 hypothetical protein P700755_003719 [Psychroflexus torquis ATCC 700755]